MQIQLTTGQFTTIDAEYRDLVERYSWHNHNGYARTNIDGRKVFLHHLILPPPNGLLVDHRNRDKLDNRSENLRLVTVAQNQFNVPVRNKYGLKGVTSQGDKFRARIKTDDGDMSLGSHPNAVAAALAYDRAAIELRGEFAAPNFTVSFDGSGCPIYRPEAANLWKFLNRNHG